MIITRKSLLEDALSFIRDGSSKISVARNSILSTITVLETLRVESTDDNTKKGIEAVTNHLQDIAKLLEMVDSR